MTPEERDEAFAWIEKRCTFGIGIVGADVIDAHGILTATETAMQQAVAQIATVRRPTYLLVDGRDKFWFDYPHSSVIDGDVLEPCIAAASIVAKVTRDRLLQDMASTFPGYGFEQHKAYGTAEHFAAINRLGPCPTHRRTFLHASVPHTPTAPLPQR
ncbi:MAG: ribonuclease HII [Candidatus Peregrinibacteria bacterium Gr01-1014_25]|nr:MAG: ribonuclease HII [Candidatus Peregrinibacteria bacterium Gr01-1014_25]